MIGAIQTHGQLLHWHPHLHVLITCGAWTPEGEFMELPEFDMERLLVAWQDAVFELDLAEEKIEPAVVENMRTWPHSGFSVDQSVFLPAGDQACGSQRYSKVLSIAPSKPTSKPTSEAYTKMPEPYIFDDTDREVVKLAMQLLAKIWHSNLVSEKEKEVVAAMGSLLKEMPEGVHDYFSASITLTGPRREFGDRKIYHCWTVQSQDGEIRVDASGHFYRPSTGGDNFTCFSWVAIPGYVTDCRDYLEHIALVDDAQPFGSEIRAIDLAEPGYQLRLEVDGELFGSDEDEYDDPEEDKVDQHDEESRSVQLSACLWAFMDADTEMIYGLAGRLYALEGTDDEILKTLKALSRHDYRTAYRVKVPARFGVVAPDGSKTKGLVSPSTLNDPNAFLFNEILGKLEDSLPPMPDYANGEPIKQSLGDNPLMCRTLVYEDAAGDCRAIVDSSDLQWLRSRTRAF